LDFDPRWSGVWDEPIPEPERGIRSRFAVSEATVVVHTFLECLLVDLSPNDRRYFSDDFTVRRIRKLVKYDFSIEERYIPLILFFFGKMVKEFNVDDLRVNQFLRGLRKSVVLVEFVVGSIENFDELVL
jgi:hypothetical protein